MSVREREREREGGGGDEGGDSGWRGRESVEFAKKGY